MQPQPSFSPYEEALSSARTRCQRREAEQVRGLLLTPCHGCSTTSQWAAESRASQDLMQPHEKRRRCNELPVAQATDADEEQGSGLLLVSCGRFDASARLRENVAEDLLTLDAPGGADDDAEGASLSSDERAACNPGLHQSRTAHSSSPSSPLASIPFAEVDRLPGVEPVSQPSNRRRQSNVARRERRGRAKERKHVELAADARKIDEKLSKAGQDVDVKQQPVDVTDFPATKGAWQCRNLQDNDAALVDACPAPSPGFAAPNEPFPYVPEKEWDVDELVDVYKFRKLAFDGRCVRLMEPGGLS